MKSLGELTRTRPVDRFGRSSAVVMLLLALWAWSGDAFALGDLGSERAQSNLARFLGELRPYPLQGAPWDGAAFLRWLVDTTRGHAGSALLDTLALSVAAIVLAALAGLVASFFAARNLHAAEPFLPEASAPEPGRRAAFRAGVWLSRGVLILARAVPEYVWAFVLLTLLGPGAWPAVIALALHNSGILGRLFADVVENADPRTPLALRGLGASRRAIAITAIGPSALGRFLLFFFYRWETCVREATILGLLGFGGLGWYVLQAQAGLRWDELALWTLLGSLLIVGGDLVSRAVRHRVQRAR